MSHQHHLHRRREILGRRHRRLTRGRGRGSGRSPGHTNTPSTGGCQSLLDLPISMSGRRITPTRALLRITDPTIDFLDTMSLRNSSRIPPSCQDVLRLRSSGRGQGKFLASGLRSNSSAPISLLRPLDLQSNESGQGKLPGSGLQSSSRAPIIIMGKVKVLVAMSCHLYLCTLLQQASRLPTTNRLVLLLLRVLAPHGLHMLWVLLRVPLSPRSLRMRPSLSMARFHPPWPLSRRPPGALRPSSGMDPPSPTRPWALFEMWGADQSS
mmetsp:Transcript_20998/g.44717  ORF Transcript_20998/g.44717 Transcript_20998/m.44717 type:complete len:267 (+) Transcript_20998:1846-2646(+)